MIPAQYAHVKAAFDIPLLFEAAKLVGIQEVVGKGSHPVIMSWAKRLGVAAIYTDDDTAWCGLAHANIVSLAGLPMPFKGYEVLRAKSWKDWGIGVRLRDAMLGDTLVFDRPGGFHVGLYVGEDDHHFYVLGGNQKNAYGFAKIEKNRCVAVRRPKYAEIPRSARKVIFQDNSAVSTNEA